MATPLAGLDRCDNCHLHLAEAYDQLTVPLQYHGISRVSEHFPLFYPQMIPASSGKTKVSTIPIIYLLPMMKGYGSCWPASKVCGRLVVVIYSKPLFCHSSSKVWLTSSLRRWPNTFSRPEAINLLKPELQSQHTHYRSCASIQKAEASLGWLCHLLHVVGYESALFRYGFDKRE